MTWEGVPRRLGNPAAWPLVSLRSLLTRRKVIGRPELPLLSVNLPNGVRLRENEHGRMAASLDRSGYTVVRPGDIVVNPLGKPHGPVGVSRFEGITSPAYWVLTTSSAAEPRFLHHLLRSQHMIAEYKRLGKHMPPNQFDISWNHFRDVVVPLPSVEEQQRIADFLDVQVALLDRAVHLRETQVALARERSLALIQSAIDEPNAPTRRLFPMLTLLRDGTHTPPPRTNDGVPLLSVRNIQDGTLLYRDDDSMVSEKDYLAIQAGCPARVGDVALAIVGTLGKTAQIDLSGRFCFQRSVAVLRPNPGLLAARYLLWCLRAKSVQDQLWLAAGYSAQPGVYLNSLASLVLPVPPLPRQAEVTARLDSIESDTKASELLLHRSIALLRERKQALMTAAVTGQFDVATASRVA